MTGTGRASLSGHRGNEKGPHYEKAGLRFLPLFHLSFPENAEFPRNYWRVFLETVSFPFSFPIVSGFLARGELGENGTMEWSYRTGTYSLPFLAIRPEAKACFANLET